MHNNTAPGAEGILYQKSGEEQVLSMVEITVVMHRGDVNVCCLSCRWCIFVVCSLSL